MAARRRTQAKPEPAYSQSTVSWLLPVAAAFICFLPAIRGDFVFDDAETIVNNPVVQGKVALFEVFKRDFWGTPMSSPRSHKSFRPLTTLSFWLNHQLHGASTLGYHLVNTCLHATITFYVFKLISKLTNEPVVSQCSSLLFALHPVHAEAVANITGRAELLMTFFFLAEICHYLKRRSIWHAAVFSALSLASKEQGSMLPLFLVVLELQSFKLNCKKKILQLLTLFGCLALWRHWINNFASPAFTANDNAIAFVQDPISRVLSILNVWRFNLNLLILPFWQCFDYSMGCISPVESLSDPRNFLNVTTVIFTLYSIWTMLKIEKSFTIAISSIGLLSFLPASHLFLTVGFTVAERVLYLPSMAFCSLISFALTRVGNTRFIYGIVIIMFSISWQRAFNWNTELDLYTNDLKICPQNAKIHYNLAKILNQKGKTNEARQEYEKALRLNPSYEQAMNNLANILEQQGNLDEASALLRKAIKIRPSFAVAWMNLGIAEMKRQNFEIANRAFENSITLRPQSADCFFNWGNLYLAQNKSEEAVRKWYKAIEIDAGHVTSWINILVHYDETGKCDEAVHISGKILRHTRHAAIHFQLGTCYGQLGQFHRAERHLMSAIMMNPDSALYHSNLGILYQRWRRYSDAEKSYLKALKIDARLTGVRDNLRTILKSRNHTDSL